MQNKTVYLSDLKFNLETWIRELSFHFDEMDTFQDKLEETVGSNLGPDAEKKLENFQNRIMIENDAIAKLKHRCKAKMRNLDMNEGVEGRLVSEQGTLRNDMRTYIKMHYDLKEEMMDFFSEYLQIYIKSHI